MIGYIFCLDRWHYNSKRIFGTHPIYCSENVKNEVEKVLNRKINDTYELIDLIINNLLCSNKKYFNTFDKFLDFINGLNDIKSFEDSINIEYVLKFCCYNIFKIKFPIDSFTLYEYFESLINNFEDIIKDRQKFIYEQIHFFKNHSIDYKLNINNINNLFHGKNKGGDFDILHDICQHTEMLKKENSNRIFCFVTTDSGFYKNVKSILEYLPIDRVKYLKDLS